jgi:hypothetical protein
MLKKGRVLAGTAFDLDQTLQCGRPCLGGPTINGRSGAMRRVLFVFLSTVLGLGGVAGQRCVAQTPPDFIHHYKVVPRVSTMEQTGGLTSVALHYRVSGDYDFAQLSLPPGAAKFANSDLSGTLLAPTPAPVVVDVDKIFNLDGLIGKQLPVAAPFDVYQFQGTASDGSMVNLYAALHGPWMYMRGGTQPPLGSTDLFSYHLRALARTGRFADLNADGVVNILDYILLRKNGPATASDIAAGATLSDWRADFANTMPDILAMDASLTTALSGIGLSTSGVPEPASFVLVLGGGLFLAGLRRRSRPSQ